MTSTFILAPSKTFKQCEVQPCIYAVVPENDECRKHCSHWKYHVFEDIRKCDFCGQSSLVGENVWND